jgi:hypothetical protein
VEWYVDEDVEKIIEKFRTTRERVEFILKKHPNARNSDFYLVILYIRYFVPELAKYIDYIPYEIIRKYDGLFETIRRTRQKIQEEGKYLPTDPEVLKKRRRLAEKYRIAFARMKDEGM